MRTNNLSKFIILFFSIFLYQIIINNTFAADIVHTDPGSDLIALAVKNKNDLFNSGKNPVFVTMVATKDKPLPTTMGTIVVFYDYNCKYSRDLMQLLKIQLPKNAYKIIYRPIGMISDTSKAIAELALAAFDTKPESFVALHQELSDLKYTLPLTVDNIKTITAKAGLKYDDLLARVNSKALGNEILQNQALYDSIKFPGVPSMILAKLDSNNNIINDKIYFIAGSDTNQLEYNLYRISIQ